VVNGDGFDDGIGGTASATSHVKVFDVRHGTLLSSFIAFPGYAGGVTVAGGDVNGDGLAEIIVGSARGLAHVKEVNAQGGLLASFMATSGPNLGVEVAAGDFDGDGKAEIVAAISGPAVVEVFDGTTLAMLRASTPFAGYNSRIGVDAFAVDAKGDDELLMVTLSGP